MDSTAISKTSKNSTRTHHAAAIPLLICFTLSLLLTASLLTARFSGVTHHLQPSPHSSLRRLIKTACSHSPHPPSCSASLSTATSPTTSPTLHHILDVAINHTITLLLNARPKITAFFSAHHLSQPQNIALADCLDMIDQSLYELAQTYPDTTSYADLNTLLSAAMTNPNTCIDGFSDLEQPGSESRSGFREFLQIQLDPISRMISNCLAIIKYMETANKTRQETLAGASKRRFPTSMERRMMAGFRGWYRFQPHVVVAKDGRGDFRTIGEAVKMAPNFGKSRFVIKIKGGVYHENVEIPRNKTNIMLAGDGMQSTVIAGSRSFLDGFSTFTSATLTVVGDRFMARDLTVVNTAGPDKHQAVAMRVTSNSAFFRCNFSSYQDTLYAHSLRQFYRDCVVEGTIDFIFGNAAAVFQNCLIRVRKPILGQRNMITAQGREDPNQNTGISMQNCTIRAAPELRREDMRVFRTYLGRPWRNHSRTVIMTSYIGGLVHPHGWCKWDKYSNLKTVEYIEYKNYGPGADTKRRVRWRGFRKDCSVEMVRQFGVRAFLHGSDDWLESNGFPFF